VTDLSPVLADLAVPPHVSVWLGEPGGPPVLARREDRVHYAASTMKLPLLVAAYRLHERGELDLDREVPVHNDLRSVHDGSVFHLDQDDDQDDETWDLVGRTATLRRLARHATVKSGNLATDLLLEHVGTAEVAAVLRDAGCSPATRLPRGIEDAAARRAGLDNLVTAADLARVLGGVATRRLASAGTCEQVEAVLAGQEHRDQVPAGLPEGTYVANKTGWVEGVAHDVALVRPAGHPAYVLVLCATADLDEETLYAANAAVSRDVWARWTA
jgi:beta-lactamase class A